MKILVISPKNKTLFNFRGDLIKDIISRGHNVVAIGPNKEYIEDILNLGVRFIEIPLIKDNTSIIGDINYYRSLKKVLKEEKPDIVFSYTIKPVIYGSLAAKNTKIKKNIPMITGLGRVYASNNFKSKLLQIITGILYKFAFKSCEKVIFQNSDDMNQFIELGYISKNQGIRVNGSGVNMNKYMKYNLPTDVSFIMIARIIKEKGIFEYLEAAKKVKALYPNVRFTLLGGFDNSIGAIREDELRPYIEQGIIDFPGESKDVVAYIKKSSVCVLPTYYREGLPRTILEAMAMGRPIITTNWPGCRDAVQHDINGKLVEPKNVDQLVTQMLYFIENPDAIKAMGEESYNLCKEKYDVNIVNQQMLEILSIS